MSLSSLLIVDNSNVDLLTAINAILVNCERDKIVQRANTVLVARDMVMVKDIPDLLDVIYGIDYFDVLNSIRIVNLINSIRKKGGNTCYLDKGDHYTYRKNKKLIDMMIKIGVVEALKHYCFKKGMYALKFVKTENSKDVYRKVYMTDQTIRKIFLIKRGDSGNPDMEEETRIDRIRGQKTPPPMSRAQINRVVTINCMLESKINAMGVGFEDLDNITQSQWRNYVENAVVVQKDKKDELIVDKFLQDAETKSRILECVRIKEEKLIELFIKNVIKKYIQENSQMKKILINKFKDYARNLNQESRVLLARNNYETIIHTFYQNINQSG